MGLLGRLRSMTMNIMMTLSLALLLSTPMTPLTIRRIFLTVTLPDSSLAELSPPLPPCHSVWRPPPDQTDSSPPVRSSLTDSLKDLTSTSSPPNKSPPTIQLPSAIHVFYLLCKLIHKIFIATFPHYSGVASYVNTMAPSLCCPINTRMAVVGLPNHSHPGIY